MYTCTFEFKHKLNWPFNPIFVIGLELDCNFQYINEDLKLDV
jgi:hypothetical protein